MRVCDYLHEGMHRYGIYQREALDKALKYRANWESCEVYKRSGGRRTRNAPTDQQVLHLVAINKLLRAYELGFSVPVLDIADHDLVYRQAEEIGHTMELLPPLTNGDRINELADRLIYSLNSILGVYEDKEDDDYPEIMTIEELEAECSGDYTDPSYSRVEEFYKACAGL